MAYFLVHHIIIIFKLNFNDERNHELSDYGSQILISKRILFSQSPVFTSVWSREDPDNLRQRFTFNGRQMKNSMLRTYKTNTHLHNLKRLKNFRKPINVKTDFVDRPLTLTNYFQRVAERRTQEDVSHNKRKPSPLATKKQASPTQKIPFVFI